MKTFEMIRKADESGVSGTGKVLQGIVFWDNKTVIRWCVEGMPNSTVIYDTFEEFKKIHIDSHPTNGTEIVWSQPNTPTYISMRPSEEEIKEAEEFVIEQQIASTSFLQRKLKIGYVKACRIMDILEEKGVVGPNRSPRPRDVLIPRVDLLTNTLV